MFFGNSYENGYLYWFVVHNLQTKISGKLLVVPGRYTALSNDKKMVTILHRELERKVEKVKQMKLEVMRPKTKDNMNFQPE